MGNKIYKLKRPKHIKHNAKATIIFCCSCLQYKYVLRNDAKFCGPTCRSHEFLFRKEKGYTKLLITGTQEELKKFYWGYTPLLQPNPLKDDYLKIIRTIELSDMTLSWKEVFDGFLVYHFPNRTTAPFEVFVDLTRFIKGNEYKKKCAPKVPPKVQSFR